VAPAAQRWRPQRLALLRGTRPLKRWRYVAVFGEQLMACAARIQIGPARQSFWAVYLREQAMLRERTHLLGGRDRVALGNGALRVADAGVLLELSLREAAPVAAHCSNDGGEVWTARSFDDGEVIDAGEHVEVVEIRGATAMVMH